MASKAVRNEIALVINYKNQNRNSFNSLLGALEANPDIDIDIFFAPTENEMTSFLKQNLSVYKKIIFAFSFFTCHTKKIADTVYNILEVRRNLNADKKVMLIAGGPHPSGDPRGTLDIGFDIVFIGEAEDSFPNFLRAIMNNWDFSQIKGLMFKEGDGYVFTGKSKMINLDEFPPFSIKHLKFGPIEITRGCPFCCYYCQTPQLFGAKVRHRSEDVVLGWVKEMRKHKLRDIRYVSPDAFSYGSLDGKNMNINALESLFSNVYEEIWPNGRQFIGTFPSEVRPEHVTENTVDIVVKYGSNDNIILGAQTGSERLLKHINRGHNIQDVYNAVNICIKRKITPHVDFIFGLPGEDEEDVDQTIFMIKNLIAMGALIHAHKFSPLPQTVFAKEEPSRIDETLKRLLGQLSKKGVLYGSINNA